MNLGGLFADNSSEYEILADWPGERVPVDDRHLVAPQAMLVVGIALGGRRPGGRSRVEEDANPY
jgi:hypothetical protein